ncbi:alpha-soluble NSF attachment protein-like [Uloborus diversus]|uniref:alpha-soluble NSF attachment protein-like n=1 Tax=Uloborus diversus TaxID=327109 RepID=UPI002409C6A7|nr:alpha-soluble NSF attachment protein-like [Uloborus diversus]
MADNEQKAMQLVADAEKKLKSAQGFLGGLFRSSSKVEDACEMYARAANMFKIAKKWSAAGSAFNEAANLRLKMDNSHDAASFLIDAGNCYKKTDAHEAIKCIIKAIEIYTDMGRFTIAAKHHITVAEIYESELADIEKAMAHYEQAADYFRGEESNSSANKCMLASPSLPNSSNTKAINIYEQVGEASLASPLMKYSAKEYYFCAALLHLCVDILNAQHAIKKYEEICPSFHDSRECKFVMTLIEKLEEQDIDGFTDAVKEYDSISRLDSWYTTILLRIKKTLQESPDLC